MTGLKGVITSDGVWRIRKREKIPILEVFKLEETGQGDILSPAFVEWRTNGLEAHRQHLQSQKVEVNGDRAEAP